MGPGYILRSFLPLSIIFLITAILVFAMIFISMMLAVLEKGANTLQTRMSVPASISDIITGILLFAMLSCEFFINYRMILRGKTKKEVEK